MVLLSEYLHNLSKIQSAPGQFVSCNHSNNSTKYGLISSSLFCDIITAQFSHTFLLCLGVNGCINGTIFSNLLAKDIPFDCVSTGLLQSIISKISKISTI